jgi:replicative DNA helicase
MPPVPEGAERLPPQSEEAERSVLGSMLRDNAVISDVVNIVRAESFYSDAHQKIYQAVVSLYDKGHPVDTVFLAEELKQRGQIEDIGNYGYLGELWDAAPTAANAEYYARIVRDRALVRNLIHVSTEILRDAYDNAQPAEELLNTAERKVFEVAQMGVTGQTYTLEQAIDVAFDRIDKRHTGDHVDLSGLPTGYTDLDEITAGLQNSEMIIIAARPSVGKTSFALNIARNIVVEGKQPSFFVSLEQSRIELAERLLCCQARVDSHRLRKGTLSAEDMQKLIEAGGVLNKAKLFIDDTPGQSMLRISANARRLKMRQGIKLVVIDYLQLIEPENRRDPRQEQVAQISRRLKALARELEIPVVALAQVNRSSEDRQDHRPRLADLRESGCLAGETLITLADTGERVPIRDLAGRSGFRVWALDEVSMKLKPAEVSNAFATGHKPVFRLETGLGRMLRATANHKFRTFTGWRRLDELKVGDRIAMPRVIPNPEEASLVSGASRRRLRRVMLATPVPSGGRGSRRAGPRRGQAGSAGASPSRCWNHFAGGNDVYWDPIVSIQPAGEADVFDLTVPGPHNFVGGSFIVHNSLEQDADTVMLLHRPDRYEPGQHDGVIEVIIGKQRNGPTGEITLTYLKQYMRYENHALGTPFEG